MVPVRIHVPLPCFVIAPPTPLIPPAKVTLAVAVPTVKSRLLKVTLLLATPLKSPIVVPLLPLMSKIEVELATDTAPVDSKEPEPDKLSVPLVIVVPLP